MKIGKVLLALVGIIILVVGAGAWYVLSNINSIVKEVVETQGAKVLQTPVSLGLVDIKLLEGSAELGDFSIKNYADFTEDKLLAFDQVKIDIDPSSVNKDVIVLDEVTVSGVSIVAEQKGLTTNIQTLLSKLPKSESTASAKSTSEDSGSSKEVLIAIKKLSFVDNTMSLATEKYGKHSLNLPAITRTNLGSASSGLAPDKLAIEVLKPLLEEAQDEAEEALVDIAKDKLKEKYGAQLDEEKEKLKSKVEDELGLDSEEVEGKLKDLKKLF